jgi:hypothetical protein
MLTSWSIRLSCALTAARTAVRPDPDPAYRVRLILTMAGTGPVRVTTGDDTLGTGTGLRSGCGSGGTLAALRRSKRAASASFIGDPFPTVPSSPSNRDNLEARAKVPWTERLNAAEIFARSTASICSLEAETAGVNIVARVSRRVRARRGPMTGSDVTRQSPSSCRSHVVG